MLSNKQQLAQERKIKFLILGKFGAGKTLLIHRLAFDRYDELDSSTLLIDFPTKRLYINNQFARLQLWDPSGQEKFQTIHSKIFYKEALGIFFVFDISNEESFQEIQNIYEKTMKEVQKMDPDVSCVLIGCKCDLEDKRAISKDVARAFAKNYGMFYIETSAKMNINCLEAAEHLGELCIEKLKNKATSETPKFDQTQQDNHKKATCY